MKVIFSVLIAGLAVPVGAQPARQTLPVHCEYFNLTTNAMTTEETPCTATYSDNGVTFRARDMTVVIEYAGQRQGQWAHVRLNGRPAMRYEIYRQSYVYATEDLTEFLDVWDRGASRR